MLGIHDYWLFVVSGIVLNITPGQDTFYIVGRSIAEGRNAGIVAALGVGSGCLVHVIAATCGLSAILATSAVAFACVKWLGVAYLTYLGLRLLFSREQSGHSFTPESDGRGWITAYWRGVLSNVLNPKVAIFFLAFLPQFVETASTQRALSFMVLGMTFIFTGTVWCLILAITFAGASNGVRQSELGGKLARRIAGTVLIGLGIRLALQGVKE